MTLMNMDNRRHFKLLTDPAIQEHFCDRTDTAETLMPPMYSEKTLFSQLQTIILILLAAKEKEPLRVELLLER